MNKYFFTFLQNCKKIIPSIFYVKYMKTYKVIYYITMLDHISSLHHQSYFFIIAFSCHSIVNFDVKFVDAITKSDFHIKIF